jgi:hypothetical protein
MMKPDEQRALPAREPGSRPPRFRVSTISRSGLTAAWSPRFSSPRLAWRAAAMCGGLRHADELWCEAAVRRSADGVVDQPRNAPWTATAARGILATS